MITGLMITLSHAPHNRTCLRHKLCCQISRGYWSLTHCVAYVIIDLIEAGDLHKDGW